MDCIVRGVTKSRTRLSEFRFMPRRTEPTWSRACVPQLESLCVCVCVCVCERERESHSVLSDSL